MSTLFSVALQVFVSLMLGLWIVRLIHYLEDNHGLKQWWKSNIIDDDPEQVVKDQEMSEALDEFLQDETAKLEARVDGERFIVWTSVGGRLAMYGAYEGVKGIEAAIDLATELKGKNVYITSMKNPKSKATLLRWNAQLNNVDVMAVEMRPQS